MWVTRVSMDRKRVTRLLTTLLFAVPAGCSVTAQGVAIGAGLRLTERIAWRELVVGCTASIGLVFALFFATAVTAPGPILLELKTGALPTIVGSGLAFGVARLLRVGQFRQSDPNSRGGR